MCRFLVYKGTEPIQLSHLVTRPRHSITNQAFESKLRFPSSRPMNADGFGIGWYDPLPVASPSPIIPHPTATPAPNSPSHKAPLPPNVTTMKITTNSPEASHFHPHSPPAGQSSSLSGVHEIIPIPSEPIDVEAPKITTGIVGGEEVIINQQINGTEAKEVELDAKATEILRLRELERELENERPCVFKSLSPAWSSANLTRLAEKIRSPLVFAHVRATTMAGAPSEDNCHPWIFGKLMWMHNGEVASFAKIKRKLQNSLPEELFLYPSGYTDSEWVFMVFLSKLKDPHARSFSHIELRTAMMETLAFLNKLSKEAGIEQPSLMNCVVSDGESVIATRYISSRTMEASSLFFSSGTSFDEYQEGGLYRMTKADKRENIIMIASEPLTFERSDWMEVKTNMMLVITPKMNLLQIPIIDEFWVPPQDPASHLRSTDFAISMGFGHGFASMENTEIAATA